MRTPLGFILLIFELSCGFKMLYIEIISYKNKTSSRNGVSDAHRNSPIDTFIACLK